MINRVIDIFSSVKGWLLIIANRKKIENGNLTNDEYVRIYGNVEYYNKDVKTLHQVN